jgi:hypothetical protein
LEVPRGTSSYFASRSIPASVIPSSSGACSRILEEERVGKRRPRSFDLRRQHRVYADVRVEEELRVRKKGRSAVESSERDESSFDGFAKIGRDKVGDGPVFMYREALGPKALVSVAAD